MIVWEDMGICRYMLTRRHKWFRLHMVLNGVTLFWNVKNKVDYYNKLCSKGETVKMLFAIGEGINDICYSATVVGIISNRQATWCGDLPESVPAEFREDAFARIWIMIKDIKEEHALKADMFCYRSNGNSLKQAISNSQFHFGYVYIPELEK